MRKDLGACVRMVLVLAVGLALVSRTRLFVEAAPSTASVSQNPNDGFVIYLPWVQVAPAVAANSGRQVNVPQFSRDIAYAQMAVFWFGQVTATANYTDVRAGYNDSELYVATSTIDRRLWYNTSPSTDSLTTWDSVSLYVSRDGATGTAPTVNSYRFDAQLNPTGAPDARYQAAYRGNGAGWIKTAIPFTTTAGWRGNALNDNGDDKGWAMGYHLPFAGLGLAGRPATGTKWGIAVLVHDRDDAIGTAIADTQWPENLTADSPLTWGQARLGLVTYTPPAATERNTVTIRHKLNGATVTDGSVGGYTTCGAGRDYWTEWGQTTWAQYNATLSDFNIQNQSDISDYPCFSKYYVTFPLDAIPAGKTVVSATLTLHQFGGSTTPNQASWIQVLTVGEAWNPSTLTWNNAPLAVQNVSQAVVEPYDCSVNGATQWPCLPRDWDVTAAIAQAHGAGQPARLALYSADSAYNSGKYFIASNTGDWNAVARPTLTVVWGDPR